MQNLVRVLEERGYFSNYLTFGEGNIRPWDWERTGRFLDANARLLWDALLCGKEVSRPKLEKVISREIVQTLMERDLCSVSSGKIKFGTNSLITSGGFPLFVSRGSIGGGYFGEDSRILMSLRPTLLEGRALSLYSGTGAEVFGLTTSPGVTLEIQGESAPEPYIQTNLELNGFSQRAAIVRPAKTSKSRSYDVIMARIPGLFEFGGIQFPELVSGGPGGNGKWEETVRLAHETLTDKGRLVFIGAFYGSKESKLAVQKLNEVFDAQGLTANVSVSSRLAMELGIPIFNQALAIAELASKKPRTELLTMLEKELETSGATHAYLVKGIAWKKRKGARGGVVDLSEHYYGTWLT